jgi:hypothetical protein
MYNSSALRLPLPVRHLQGGTWSDPAARRDSQGNVKDCEPVARREEPEEDLVSRAVDEDVVDGTREMASQPNLQPSAVQPDSGDDDEDEVCHLVEEQEAVSELLKARDLAKRYR